MSVICEEYQKIILDNNDNLLHNGAVHIVGAAPASKGFFSLGYMPELQGCREALGVPTNVNTTRAFLLPEVQSVGDQP